MILDYDDDQIIQVYEPVANDPLSPIIVELQTLPLETGGGWALVFAFRLSRDPNEFRVFAFRTVSHRGVELLLAEVGMELRRLRQPATSSCEPPPMSAASLPISSPEIAHSIDLRADQITDGFEPSHSVESEWDRNRRLEIVFHACLVRSDGNSLGLGHAIGIPLLFTSSAATSCFIAAFDAEVGRVHQLVQQGRLRPRDRCPLR